MISTIYSVIMIIKHYRKTKEMSTTQLIGVLGLIGSVITIYFTDNSKFYYIPALAINIITFGIMLVLSIKKKSVLHFLVRDLDLASVNMIPEDKLLPVNICAPGETIHNMAGDVTPDQLYDALIVADLLGQEYVKED